MILQKCYKQLSTNCLFLKTNNEKVKLELGYKKELGEQDFLRLLTEQLKHQDPTAPMKDTDFMAQMVQFSTLEMIDGMSKELNIKGINDMRRVLFTFMRVAYTAKVKPIEKLPMLPIKAFPR